MRRGSRGCLFSIAATCVYRRRTPSPLSNLVTVSLQRAAVERVPGDAGEAGDDFRRGAAAGAGGDELGDSSCRRGRVGRSLLARGEHDRDLALRRLAEASGDLTRRPPDHLLEVLRELAADGSAPL